MNCIALKHTKFFFYYWTPLTQCKDLSSRSTLYQAAVIRNHERILDVSQNEGVFPEIHVKYHRSCRAEFTLKRDLGKIKAVGDVDHEDDSTRRSSRSSLSYSILPDQCIFCKKSKYKPNTKTKEKLHSVQEFRADEKVRHCAILHVQQYSEQSAVAKEIIGICSKDVMSAEVRYHSTCYKSFVRISYDTKNDEANSTSATESKCSKLQLA